MLGLAAVAFCDSAGLGVLVEADQATRDNGHVLTVARVCPRVLRLLVTTGLHRRLTLDPPVPPANPYPRLAVRAPSAASTGADS